MLYVIVCKVSASVEVAGVGALKHKANRNIVDADCVNGVFRRKILACKYFWLNSCDGEDGVVPDVVCTFRPARFNDGNFVLVLAKIMLSCFFASCCNKKLVARQVVLAVVDYPLCGFTVAYAVVFKFVATESMV